MGIQSPDEFQLVLDELGLKSGAAKAVQSAFTDVLLFRLA